ncbi:hypothetical protein LSTR_LSTR003776 [Laodelphax striatellus]|uniref:Uncharacterized protein n=1 Tax=Laodelphax striatellus TaxID=195883 RepID=A0A482WPX7_LAOST|nr:hypothetical protein LSTR_LSTR003776 [Laodelphax striatellus]
MKFLYFAVFGCALVIFTSAMPPSTAYSTMYDHINVDNILKNDILFNQYFTCLTKKAGCTPEGELLAAAIPDALATSCAKCSDEQKATAEKVMQYLYFNKRDQFEELATIYDPKGVFLEYYFIDDYMIHGSWLPGFQSLTSSTQTVTTEN